MVQVLVHVVEDHSQLFSIAVLAAQLHQDFLSQLDGALSDQMHLSSVCSDQVIEFEFFL